MKVGETCSDETTYGVAQGSILGPSLFSDYTRTFPGRVKVTVKFTVEGYADDHQVLGDGIEKCFHEIDD